jgi:8-oxo-dGTP pyrophosphatase MutT (NUDIX family)
LIGISSILPGMFAVLSLGDWPPGQVHLDWTTNSRRLLPDVESAIELAWQQALQRPGALLFDGPMCRLERWDAQPDQLHLTLSPCNYKTFFGTNMTHPEFAEKFGPYVLANPVGLSTALCSFDGSLLLGHRTQNVAYYPGRIHPFAGSLEPKDHDVFTAMRRELHEELSLTDTELSDLRCLGIISDNQLRQPELIFTANSPLNSSQIISRLDTTEHRAAHTIPATADGIEAALATDCEEMTPVAIASILLWGRRRFGVDWFQRLASPKLITTGSEL